MHYSLRRVSDGAGDSGLMSTLFWEEDGEVKTELNGRPRIGVAMKVGNPFGGIFSTQDWWMCTPATKILIDEENYVKFETRNSTYEWKTF